MQSKSKKFVGKKRLVVLGMLVGVGVVLYDIAPIGGNITFYSKWIECGKKPVAANMEWRVGGGTPPHYGEPPTVSLMRLSPEYFCTPLEAEQAGFSASSQQYEFPHLKRDDAE